MTKYNVGYLGKTKILMLSIYSITNLLNYSLKPFTNRKLFGII